MLLALVYADYRFAVIDVGSYDRNSDGGLLDHSTLEACLMNNSLNLPKDERLGSKGEVLPYVIVADEAFKLTKHIMKPYPRHELTDDKRLFNYKLSAARQMVECTFRALTSKFQIFETPIGVSPALVDDIIKCAAVFHNMIRAIDKECDDNFETYTLQPQGGAFQNVTQPRNTKNQSTREARQIRDKFKDYLTHLNEEH